LSVAAADPAPAEAHPAFSPRTVLALVLVGLVAFAGFCVLATYAPELRASRDPGAHALSPSAIGYRGATVMLRALEHPVTIVRSQPSPGALHATLLVVTPGPQVTAKAMRKLPRAQSTLIVLPKWVASPEPLHPGFVFKAGHLHSRDLAVPALDCYETGSQVSVVPGAQSPELQSLGGPWEPGGSLDVGRLDGLQTISGPGWTPVLADAHGRAVMAQSKSHPGVYVLSEPDLLNNQGLKDLTTADSAMSILTTMSGEDGIAFDVTLNGLGRERNLARMALEPPWLAATLCVLATAALMGWLALARFGQTLRPGRGIALGATALAENAAGLIRMAKKEPALGASYAESVLAAALKSGGGAHLGGEGADEWLARAAARRGLADPRELAAEAAGVKTNDELTAVANKLHRWRLEMTGESS